jgi:hypothetical protein
VKKLFFCICIIICSFTIRAQLIGGLTYPINGISNAPTSFVSIQQAATYLASNGVTGIGNVVLELQTGYLPAAEPTNGINFTFISGANSNRRIILRPAFGFITNIIDTINAGASLNLNGVKFLTIDGRQGGTGSIGLTFFNTSQSNLNNTSALKLSNGAEYNIIKYCSFKGAAKADTVGGVLLFANGSSCNFNTIEYNEVNGMANAHNGICSYNTIAININDTIRNNKVFDNFNPVDSGSAGILLKKGNNNWVISGNSLYQTAPRLFTENAFNFGIFVGTDNSSSESVLITNNFIGGTAPFCQGMSYFVDSTLYKVLGFVGIHTTTANATINYNTIKNFTIIFNSTFLGYGVYASYDNSGIYAYTNKTGLLNIQNNIIDSIQVFNTYEYNGTFNGILMHSQLTEDGTINTIFNCTFNTISNLTAYSALNLIELNGIYYKSDCFEGLLYTSINNTFANCKNNNINNLLGQGFNEVIGIKVLSYDNQIPDAVMLINGLIENNIISNILADSKGTILMGIWIRPSIEANIKIKNNQIFNLINSSTFNFPAHCIGIYLFLCQNVLIEKNTIYNLESHARFHSNNYPSFCAGVTSYDSKYISLINNHIYLSHQHPNDVQLFGYLVGSFTDFTTLYNNTMAISGSFTDTTTRPSACIGRVTLNFGALNYNMNIKNNLLINTRTGGAGKHYALALGGSLNPLECSHNTYITADSNAAFFKNGVNLNFDSLKVKIPSDQYSYYAKADTFTNFNKRVAKVNINNLFANNNYLNNGNLMIDSTKAESWLVFGKGAATPAVYNDFYSNRRDTVLGKPTNIGAHQFNTNSTPPPCFITGNIATNDSSIISFAGRKVARINWNTGGTLPTNLTAKYFSGKKPSLVSNSVYAASHFSESYWAINTIGGSGYNYSPFIYFTPHEIGNINNTSANTKLAYLNNANTSFTFLGNTATANINNIPQVTTINNINNILGSNTAFILTDNVASLPVHLTQFEGFKYKKDVLLNWTTASEINNNYFELERSYNGTDFFAITQIKGAGNANYLNNYKYNDKNIFATNSVIYYRLKQVDFNGDFTFSKIIKITSKQAEDIIEFAPNPFNDFLNLNLFSETETNAFIQIFDINGLLLFNKTEKLTNGKNSFSYLEVSSLKNGFYVLTITINNNTFTYKLVK